MLAHTGTRDFLLRVDAFLPSDKEVEALWDSRIPRGDAASRVIWAGHRCRETGRARVSPV